MRKSGTWCRCNGHAVGERCVRAGWPQKVDRVVRRNVKVEATEKSTLEGRNPFGNQNKLNSELKTRFRNTHLQQKFI